MDELQRGDLRRFGLGLLRWPAIGLLVAGLALLYATLARGGGPTAIPLASAGLLLVFALETARKWSRAHEFRSPKLRYLWRLCEERLERFEEARRKHRRTDLPELTEMPVTIRGVSRNLRLALRRADVLLKEVEASEGVFGGVAAPPVAAPPVAAPPVVGQAFGGQAFGGGAVSPEILSDRDTNTLYQLADRNVAEYRAGLGNLLAGVARTEAQATVFATTLDTLRVKMLGYRLGTRRPELETREFVGSVHEAKAQMDAIERALEDLELGVFARPLVDPGPPIVGSPGASAPPAAPPVQRIGEGGEER